MKSGILVTASRRHRIKQGRSPMPGIGKGIRTVLASSCALKSCNLCHCCTAATASNRAGALCPALAKAFTVLARFCAVEVRRLCHRRCRHRIKQGRSPVPGLGEGVHSVGQPLCVEVWQSLSPPLLPPPQTGPEPCARPWQRHSPCWPGSVKLKSGILVTASRRHRIKQGWSPVPGLGKGVHGVGQILCVEGCHPSSPPLPPPHQTGLGAPCPALAKAFTVLASPCAVEVRRLCRPPLPPPHQTGPGPCARPWRRRSQCWPAPVKLKSCNLCHRRCCHRIKQGGSPVPGLGKGVHGVGQILCVEGCHPSSPPLPPPHQTGLGAPCPALAKAFTVLASPCAVELRRLCRLPLPPPHQTGPEPCAWLWQRHSQCWPAPVQLKSGILVTASCRHRIKQGWSPVPGLGKGMHGVGQILCVEVLQSLSPPLPPPNQTGPGPCARPWRRRSQCWPAPVQLKSGVFVAAAAATASNRAGALCPALAKAFTVLASPCAVEVRRLCRPPLPPPHQTGPGPCARPWRRRSQCWPDSVR